MNFVKSLSLVPVVVFAMTSPALCQDAPATRVRPDLSDRPRRGRAQHGLQEPRLRRSRWSTESACTMTSWHTRASTTWTI